MITLIAHVLYEKLKLNIISKLNFQWFIAAIFKAEYI